MASFRTGFKIFGEISLKQGFGRIRSFSEDRKPGKWLPEDQWAVRHPGSTCPDPCIKPKKSPKPSKSWLSICRDPPNPIECDVRHNNCPPAETKDAPWYSLDNFIPKKKQEKTPPLQSCREEMRRRELCGEKEEVCENIPNKTFPVHIKPEPTDCCMPEPEPCPAPVVTLSCPLPKELDIMLWCERSRTDSCRIPVPCQSGRLPYDEFRPQKCWKPPPFSLPVRSDPPSPFMSGRCCDSVAYAEFKQVDVPRPLYTRYKSVEFCDKDILFCMTEVKCPDENDSCKLAIDPPLPATCNYHPVDCCVPEMETKQTCLEKPFLVAGSCKPVILQKAPKYKFRLKPTKLVERVVRQYPLSQSKSSDMPCRETTEEDCCVKEKEKDDCEPPKVITGTLTHEPQTFERQPPMRCCPPKWMYMICKPGANATPLVPCKEQVKEPDCAGETDGLKFYDGCDECLTPKPRPDPYLEKPKVKPCPAEPELNPEPPKPCFEFRNRFVLMPEQYNIKYSREQDHKIMLDDSESSTFEKFIEVKTTPSKQAQKSYPPMKENILYDLQRLCPNPPLDPSKLNAPCRKPPQPVCPRIPRFYRSYSTFHPTTLGLHSLNLCQFPRRTECEDTSGKCKARQLIPKPRPCPKPVKPEFTGIKLPCCPKANIPPYCNLKRPMLICKKKLPPKPSFSECSKDPPPCPRNTECDCWEKKLGGKRKGK